VVTRQGKEQVVVLPAEQFAQLTKRVRQPKSLVRFFAESRSLTPRLILVAILIQVGRSTMSGFLLNT